MQKHPLVISDCWQSKQRRLMTEGHEDRRDIQEKKKQKEGVLEICP